MQPCFQSHLQFLQDKPRKLSPNIRDVLDPFMGSGTTLVAARELGHVAHGIDLSPDNVRIAADRQGVSVP